jgi:Domain of unknown function (DUF3859)
MKLHCKIALVAIMALASATHADPSSPESSVHARIIDYGLTRETGEQHIVQNPDTPDGKQANIYGLPKFIEHTDRVPAKLGVSFGFVFRITGLKDQEWIELRKVVHHPSMRNAKGKQEVQYATNVTVPVRNGEVRFGAGYRLDRAEDLKPGVWTFQILYRGQKLLSQSFTVYAAK